MTRASLVRRITLVAIGWTLVALPASASATERMPGQITLEQLLRLLAARAPRLLTARTNIPVAEAEVTAAGVLPNPSLSYVQTRTAAGSDTIGGVQHLATLEVPLLIEGQRTLRLRAAELAVATARADLRAFEADLSVEARRLFVELLAAQEQVRVLEETSSDMQNAARIVEMRAQAGVKSQYDVERIRVERAALRERLTAARIARDQAAARIATLAGVPGWLPVATGQYQPLGVSADENELWSQAERSLPAIMTARSAEVAASASVRAARRDAWPVPTISLGAFATTDPVGTGLLFGVSVPVPIFDRNQGAVARGRAEAQRARVSRETVVLEARAELERAARVLTHTNSALAAFNADVMSRLAELRRMAEDAYRNGQGGIVELLDALDKISEMKLRHVELVGEVMRAEVDVLAAAGRATLPGR